MKKVHLIILIVLVFVIKSQGQTLFAGFALEQEAKTLLRNYVIDTTNIKSLTLTIGGDKRIYQFNINGQLISSVAYKSASNEISKSYEKRILNKHSSLIIIKNVNSYDSAIVNYNEYNDIKSFVHYQTDTKKSERNVGKQYTSYSYNQHQQLVSLTSLLTYEKPLRLTSTLEIKQAYSRIKKSYDVKGKVIKENYESRTLPFSVPFSPDSIQYIESTFRKRFELMQNKISSCKKNKGNVTAKEFEAIFGYNGEAIIQHIQMDSVIRNYDQNGNLLKKHSFSGNSADDWDKSRWYQWDIKPQFFTNKLQNFVYDTENRLVSKTICTNQIPTRSSSNSNSNYCTCWYYDYNKENTSINTYVKNGCTNEANEKIKLPENLYQVISLKHAGDTISSSVLKSNNYPPQRSIVKYKENLPYLLENYDAKTDTLISKTSWTYNKYRREEETKTEFVDKRSRGNFIERREYDEKQRLIKVTDEHSGGTTYEFKYYK